MANTFTNLSYSTTFNIEYGHFNIASSFNYIANPVQPFNWQNYDISFPVKERVVLDDLKDGLKDFIEEMWEDE